MENCTEANATQPSLTDEHGCYLPEGYVWCELKQKCIQPWAEECAISPEDEAQQYCDGFSRVYLCGGYVKVVSPIAGNGSTFHKSGVDTIACEMLAPPDYMSPLCQALMDNCVERRVC
jgi:hypothetical protein